MTESDILNLDKNFVGLLLDSMADGVFVLNESGKISIWNRAMESITGYMANEVRGKGCELLNFDF